MIISLTLSVTLDQKVAPPNTTITTITTTQICIS